MHRGMANVFHPRVRAAGQYRSAYSSASLQGALLWQLPPSMTCITPFPLQDVASRLSACAAAAADIEALLRGKPLPGAPPTLPHSSQPHVSTAPLPAQDASPYPISGPGFHCL